MIKMISSAIYMTKNDDVNIIVKYLLQSVTANILLLSSIVLVMSSRCVSRSGGGGGGGGWRSHCIEKGYSEPTRAESREGTSTLAESSRVT